jgi:cytochrome c oxidase assembly factor CtaG
VTERARSRTLGGLAALVVAGVVAPPLSVLARRYLLAGALQYCALGLVGPGLFVASRPWGLAGPLPAGPGRLATSPGRLATSPARIASWFLPSLAVLLAWRTPVLVDAVVDHPILLLPEALSLLVAGTVLWVHLLPSSSRVAPLAPAARIPVAAVTMWGIWIVAYAVGMSSADPYPAFRHGAGRAISLAADRQLSTGALWFVAAAIFVPVCLRNLVVWLRSDADALASGPQPVAMVGETDGTTSAGNRARSA